MKWQKINIKLKLIEQTTSLLTYMDSVSSFCSESDSAIFSGKEFFAHKADGLVSILMSRSSFKLQSIPVKHDCCLLIKMKMLIEARLQG